MRIYENRLGRFLTVDPLTVKYPELTPYQFASNTPIESIDLDGAERISYLRRNESHNAVDVVGNLPGNVLVGTYNIGASIWNKLVDYVESMSGDPIAGFFAQAGKDWDAVKSGVKSMWNYHSSTPFKQQISDYVTQAKSWDNWAQAVEVSILLFAPGKVNTALKVENGAVGAIKATGAVEAAATAGLRERYIAAVTGLKGIGENLLRFGVDEKYVAEAMSIARRKLGETFKDATPADLREWIYKFNENRYQDKLGPTYEFFKKVKNKTDKEIIESSSRPLGTKAELGAALYKEFGEAVRTVLEKYEMMPKQ